MTSPSHNNGTERTCEAIENINCDYVCIIMGDEPLLNFEYIKESVDALHNSDADMSVLVNKFYKISSPSDFKAVLDKNNNIMYISRNDIPSNYKNKLDYMLKVYHIATFKKEILSIYRNLEYHKLDDIEDHEFLRLLENGYKIRAKCVESSAISLDTYDDYEFIKKEMKKNSIFEKYKHLIKN